MRLHKIVNGVKVDLTDEEETQIRAEWEANRIEEEKRRQDQKATLERASKLKEKICSALNITEDDLNIILGKI